MSIQTEYLSSEIVEQWVVALISRHSSSVPKVNGVLPRLLYSVSRHSQTCPWHSQACCRHSQVLSGLSSALPGLSPVLPGAPKVLSGAPRCSHTYQNHSHGIAVTVIRDPSYSEAWQECPPKVSYSPEIDTSKSSLHILLDSPGVYQWLKYILLMYYICETIPVHLKSGAILTRSDWYNICIQWYNSIHYSTPAQVDSN
jgi:hypothetical protein